MADREISRNHLKLVVTNNSHADHVMSHQTVSEGIQLRLPFEDESAVILVHEMELSSPEAFDIFIERYRPKWLLDIRVAPRMDFVAPTRTLALRTLSALNVNYVDVLGRVHDTSKWLQFLEDLLQSQGRVDGLYAIFFDDTCTLRDARLHIPPLLHRLESSENVRISTFHRDLIAM